MVARTKGQTTYIKSETRRKFQTIAKSDRRSLVDTLDVVADEALRSRGLDKRKGRK